MTITKQYEAIIAKNNFCRHPSRSAMLGRILTAVSAIQRFAVIKAY